MNAKKLIVAVAVSACAAGAFAADAARVDFYNTATPHEVTAQNAGSLAAAATTQAKSTGEQSAPAINFANSVEPSLVTAQPGARQGK